MKTKLSNFVKSFALFITCVMLSTSAMAQSRKITGRVTGGSDNQPIPGASVVIKGTTIGTTTDANGNYSLNLKSANDVLLISSVGYTFKEIKAGNQSTLNVALGEDYSELTEVVVTGYAAQQKKDITGSVAIIDTRDMVKLASSNFADQLQGKVAGVQMSSSGDPGSAAFVRIRGVGTINNNEPLYVIDGIPVQNESNMNFINPSDIESMQVLKDAASASIYGSRAANGVIVITTKKGKAGSNKLNLDVWYGSQSPTKVPETLNPEEFLKVQQGLAAGQGIDFTSNVYIKNGSSWSLPDYAVRGQGGFAAGNPAVDPSKYYLNPDPTGAGPDDYLILQTNKAGTNWFNEVFKTAPMKNIQLSASGGSEKGTYFISGNAYNHDGILINNNYKRYQARANTSFNIKKNIRFGNELNVAYQTTRGGVGNPNEGSALIGTYGMPQLVPVKDIKGNWASPANFNANVSNPVAQQARADFNFGHSWRITGNIHGEVDLTDYLTFQSKFGIDYGTGPNQSYGTRRYDATEGNRNPNSMQNNYYLNRNWVFFNTLSFNKTFGEHKITALAGVESKENYYEGFSAGGTELAFGDNPNYRLLQNVNPKTYYMSSYRGENTVFSQFAQASYSLMDRYLLSGTVRRDGSSRFLNNKYGIFPAASIGWRISKEDFMKGLTFISDLKLRASYGVLGNNEVGGDYPGYSNFGTSPGTSSYDLRGTGNSNIAGFDQTSTGNPDLKWESTAVTNIGLDAELFKNFTIGLEWYKRATFDMIYGVELPLELGAVGSQAQNIGKMNNTGIDAQISYRGSAMNKALTFNVGVTGSTVKNEVTAIEANSNTFIRSGGSRIGDITYTTNGKPLSQFYGFVVDGLWKTNDEIKAAFPNGAGEAKVGRFRYRDINGDGKLDNADETILGSPLPTFLLGLNLSAAYKNFDFTAYISGTYGNKIFNFVKYFSHFNAFQRNRSKEFLYEAGKTLPVLDGGDNYSSQRNSYYVEDGSFTRLKNLQLGYSLAPTLTNKLGLGKLRVYVSAQNLFTLTKYSGLDPDVTVSNITEGYVAKRDLSLGVDYGRYPTARQLLVGANIEF